MLQDTQMSKKVVFVWSLLMSSKRKPELIHHLPLEFETTYVSVSSINCEFISNTPDFCGFLSLQESISGFTAGSHNNISSWFLGVPPNPPDHHGFVTLLFQVIEASLVFVHMRRKSLCRWHLWQLVPNSWIQRTPNQQKSNRLSRLSI